MRVWEEGREAAGEAASEGLRDLHSYSQSASPVGLLKGKAPSWPPRHRLARAKPGACWAGGGQPPPGAGWDVAPGTGSLPSGSQHFCC